jgi:hypothetical protein
MVARPFPKKFSWSSLLFPQSRGWVQVVVAVVEVVQHASSSASLLSKKDERSSSLSPKKKEERKERKLGDKHASVTCWMLEKLTPLRNLLDARKLLDVGCMVIIS